MRDRECDPVAFWMRVLTRFFIFIFVPFPLSLFSSGEFRCELLVIFSFFQCGWYFTVYTRIASMHMQMHMRACIYVWGYTRVFCDNSTLDDDEPRENCARIILSNKIISRHAELYNQLRFVVPCFFNREQIRVFFGYIDTRIFTCVFSIREIVDFWKNVIGVIIATAFMFERIHFWETGWVYLLMISNANEKYGLSVGS